MKRTSLLLPILLLLCACGNSSGSASIDPRLVAIYCDLATAAGDQGQAAPDSVRSRIFASHGTTQEDYESALAPFREDPSRWVVFFRAVTDTMDARVIQQYSGYLSPPPTSPIPDPG